MKLLRIVESAVLLTLTICLGMFIVVSTGCAKKTIIPPPATETRQEAEQAVKDAQEEVQITKGAIDSQKDNIDAGIDLTQNEAEIEQAKALIRQGRYKKAVELARKAQKDAYGDKADLLALVLERQDRAIELLPGQPGYEETGQDLQRNVIEYVVGTWEINRDCLWNIAKNVLNDPWAWKRIYLANKDKIKDPNLIYTGQILIVPLD